MKYRIVLGYFLLINPILVSAQTDTAQHVISNRHNSPEQEKKPYVILISVDGFRSDYMQKYPTPELSKHAAEGVQAEYMSPSFPALTFPNHLSIVTGLYPSHHGIVDNMFYDRRRKENYTMNDRNKVRDASWYGGTPLWVLAEKQKMVSASFYWVGSEAPIQGTLPSYYYYYSDKISFATRLAAVRNWLTLPEETRPHLIAFYFPQVDHEGHYHGPDSPETKGAVEFIDRSIQQMTAMTDSLKLPVNYVFVSDHGMAATDTVKMLKVPELLKDTAVCRWTYASNLINVYVKDPNKINALYQALTSRAVGFDVHLQNDTPAAWHFKKADDRFGRIGDIIITSHFPRYFKISKGHEHIGKHGYDPSRPEMRATFLAWGPQIKKAGKIPAFENVNVYPFVAKLLGLKVTDNIDGDEKVLGFLVR